MATRPSAVDLTIPDQRGASPSSLTRPGARSGQNCPSCGSERLTALAMTLTDGTPVSFCSCHDCEQKSWSDAAGRLEFADVLVRTAKRK